MTIPVTKEDVQLAVEQLGIANRPICVHASLRSFGWVEGGATAVVEGMLAAGCTVLVPSFSDFAILPPDAPAMRPERNGTDYISIPRDQPGTGRIYSPASKRIDREDMGAVAAAVVVMPGRVRGNHPLNSFTAVGPLAHQLIDGQQPTDVYRPLEMLVELGGWTLLMGTTLRSLTLLHLAEKQAGRTLFRRWANDPEGQVMMVETGSCSLGFDAFEPVLAPLERSITVATSRWRAFEAARVLEVAVPVIRHNPSITQCGRPGCERCRDAVLGGPVLQRED